MEKLKKILRKHWSNILFVVLLVLLIIPKTRMMIQVPVQRIISFSPSKVKEGNREVLPNYHWSLLDLNKQQFNLSSSSNKVVIINMWATWCPPCVAEMPSFQKLYNDYSEKIDFYFITSEEPDRIEKFMDKHDYSLPVYLQTHEAPEKLESRLLPTTFVISKSGEIVIRETGSANWNSKKTRDLLDRLLEE